MKKTAKEYLKESKIGQKLDDIMFTESVQFETGFSDIEVYLPEWMIERIKAMTINLMESYRKASEQEAWKDEAKELPEHNGEIEIKTIGKLKQNNEDGYRWIDVVEDAPVKWREIPTYEQV